LYGSSPRLPQDFNTLQRGGLPGNRKIEGIQPEGREDTELRKKKRVTGVTSNL
jgi:hypothetical protein